MPSCHYLRLLLPFIHALLDVCGYKANSLNFFLHACWYTDERLNDIVGSAYYVAPEVLHRSYSLEADIWSIGVITYILLCGSRPFWARTESGIFRAVLRADPNFDDLPWPTVSAEAKDFVKRLLNKDYRKRMTAVQALSKLSYNLDYVWQVLYAVKYSFLIIMRFLFSEPGI